MLAGIVGCAGNPVYFPYFLPPGTAEQTHAKPPGIGYYSDYDPKACQIQVRPDAVTSPVRGTQLLVATVFDADGLPLRNRRVEWTIEGPGSIVEVDESGYLPGRGMKVDSKYAYSHTDYFTHTLPGSANKQEITPGQTWCLITSPVEGQTNVIVHVPAIANWQKNKAFVKIFWLNGEVVYPDPAKARSGSAYTFRTKLPNSASARDYRVRYRVIDGPPVLIRTAQANDSSKSELLTTADDQGVAPLQISQVQQAKGTNRIAIEVVKPDPVKPDQMVVVSKGETTIQWLEPELSVQVNAPKSAGLNNELPVKYDIRSTGDLELGSVTVNATIPAGMELVRTEPKAVADGNLLIWNINQLPAGQSKTVEAIYRPVKLGPTVLQAHVRSSDGLSSDGETNVDVSQTDIKLSITGPSEGIVGQLLPFDLVVTNDGGATARNVRVRVKLGDGLETEQKKVIFEDTIEELAPGGNRAYQLKFYGIKPGETKVYAGTMADNGKPSPTQEKGLVIHESKLNTALYGPESAQVGQEFTWQIAVRNSGQTPVGNVVLKADVPANFTFLKASDGGTLQGNVVTWNLGTAPERQDRLVSITAKAIQAGETIRFRSAVRAEPLDSASKVISTVKPLEHSAEKNITVTGIPAVELSLRDRDDPLSTGAITLYTVKVKNTGTAPTKLVEVTIYFPPELKPVQADGRGVKSNVDLGKVTFAVPPLAPGQEQVLDVQAQAMWPGDARISAVAVTATQREPIRVEQSTKIISKENRPR
ncbi:MAG: hypothetical protein R3B84_21165 [Zavarzinella sp.]